MNTLTLQPLRTPITATVTIPGSKSYTNRALILGALTLTPVTIHNPLFSDDTKAMISCLLDIGIAIEVTKNSINVIGSIADVENDNYELNAQLSGTTIRFMLALSCIVPGIKIISGYPGLNRRPIGGLVKGLKMLGAEISYLEKEDMPPLRITSSTLIPGETAVSGEISSQYFSSLLLIAPIVGDVTITVKGKQISRPYIDMTIDSMRQFGVSVENNAYKQYKVHKQAYAASDYTVEGDYSSASYFAAIAALTKSTILLKNISAQSKQADREFFQILKQMGNEVLYNEDTTTVKGVETKPMIIDMENCPDQVQTLAVLAAFTKGTTVISGIKTLRVKETNRVEALHKELAKMSIQTEETNELFIVHGGNPKAATIDTYGDHRMAMSFAVAGAKLPGMKINDHEVVTKTFPSFWEKLEEIGIKIERSK